MQKKCFFDKLQVFNLAIYRQVHLVIMVDSADIYFIQHFADINFSKSICISVCRGIK